MTISAAFPGRLQPTQIAINGARPANALIDVGIRHGCLVGAIALSLGEIEFHVYRLLLYARLVDEADDDVGAGIRVGAALGNLQYLACRLISVARGLVL